MLADISPDYLIDGKRRAENTKCKPSVSESVSTDCLQLVSIANLPLYKNCTGVFL